MGFFALIFVTVIIIIDIICTAYVKIEQEKTKQLELQNRIKINELLLKNKSQLIDLIKDEKNVNRS